MKKNIILLISILAILNFGCKKGNTINDKDDNQIPTTITEDQRFAQVITTAQVQLFLHGYILDEAESPIPGAEVKAGNQSATTDESGYFVFPEIKLNKEFAVVKASKTGFLRAIRTFTPTKGAINRVELIMQTKGSPKTLDANNGGQLSFESGKLKLDFPKGSIIDKNGKAYNGEVKVYARYINPELETFASTMPGNLVGMVEDNSLTGMISYGMANVVMEDNSGNILQIADGQSVKVTMPAILDVPNEMPIWHFNETYGLWVLTETVQKENNEYSFEANHFSYWNLDITAPDGTDRTNVTLKTSGGHPLGNQKVEIHTSNFSHRLVTVYTDNKGQLDLLSTPKNLGFRIHLECTDIDKIADVSSGNVTIIFDANSGGAKIYQISGEVKDCDKTYSNSYFVLQGIDNRNISFSGLTDSEGKFSNSFILCNVNPSEKYKVRVMVYIENNRIKADTLELVFSSTSIQKDINFCEAEEGNNPYLNPNLTYGSITDIDGNKYATIKIGNQTWMAENLKTTRYNDGTAITNIKEISEWKNNPGEGAWVSYNNDTANDIVYGKLYNWYAVNTGKLCPNGWHIPTNSEWTELSDYLGNKAGTKMKSTAGWDNNGNGDNSSGFSGLPGGSRDDSGTFGDFGKYGLFWSSTENNAIGAWFRQLDYSTSNLHSYSSYKKSGFSCRCVLD